MTAPNPDRALMEIVHRAAVRALHQLDVERRGAYEDAPTDWHIDQATAVMDAVLPALAESGRLLSVGARTATQFGVRFTRADGSSWVSECSEGAAEDRAEFYAKRRAEGPHQIVSAEVVQRDGGSWVGPWVPVPTTPETP